MKNFAKFGSILVGAALVVAGCGGSSGAPADAAGVSSSSQDLSVPVGGKALTIDDAWVKATEGTDDTSMTAVFGVITNSSDSERTAVSVSTSVSNRAELHEMAMVDGAMVMRRLLGGIPVPPGESVTLSPGGLHVMVLEVPEPVAVGDQVEVSMTFDDGSTVDFTALAKDFAGANEKYEPGPEMGSMQSGPADGS